MNPAPPVSRITLGVYTVFTAEGDDIAGGGGGEGTNDDDHCDSRRKTGPARDGYARRGQRGGGEHCAHNDELISVTMALPARPSPSALATPADGPQPALRLGP